MKRLTIILVLFSMMLLPTSAAGEKTVTLHILETTDVHGCFFPWDFINKRPMQGSLARTSTYINQLRQQNPDGVILLENGDILQGQPINYYYNFLATDRENIASRCINYLHYDAQNWGNHDVEPGHAIYDKWSAELSCPVLGANIINTATGKPYLKPYTIVERQGIRVAVIGMLTPAIPMWLTEDIWQGLQFREMVSCAREWVSYVQQHEHPDVIVGLFHSGREGGIVTPDFEEDASMHVAEQVPGFDIIMFGHDHQLWNKTITNSAQQPVVTINPRNNAQYVADATVTLTLKRGKVTSKTITAENVDVRSLPIDEAYMQHFAADIDSVKAWADSPIGTMARTITTRDSFFGSSAFTDLIHNLQLRLTGADISFTAPLTFNATIQAGPITVSDMFNLYKFENKLCVMELTGEEIQRYLELSYALWTNTMTTPDDHIMLLNIASTDDNQRSGFKNMTFNFDSAAGIIYTVDVTKPIGQKVIITSMADGQPFLPAKRYRVAVNSYRANGGGELLTQGAGIPKDQLESRIISRTPLDLRHYLMEEIKRQGTIDAQPNNNWRFTPDDWAVPALQRDRRIIYPNEQ